MVTEADEGVEGRARARGAGGNGWVTGWVTDGARGLPFFLSFLSTCTKRRRRRRGGPDFLFRSLRYLCYPDYPSPLEVMVFRGAGKNAVSGERWPVREEA